MLRRLAQSSTGLFLLATCVCAVALYLLICRLGMIQFLGYDGGIFTNGAWQMHLDYQPYKDLIGGYPPLFYMGGKWAFDWFGVEWFSLVKMGGLFAAVTLIIQALLLRRVIGPWWALLIACFSQAVTSLPTACWSHDWTSTVTGVLFYSALLAWRAKPDRTGTGVAISIGRGASLIEGQLRGPLLCDGVGGGDLCGVHRSQDRHPQERGDFRGHDTGGGRGAVSLRHLALGFAAQLPGSRRPGAIGSARHQLPVPLLCVGAQIHVRAATARDDLRCVYSLPLAWSSKECRRL